MVRFSSIACGLAIATWMPQSLAWLPKSLEPARQSISRHYSQSQQQRKLQTFLSMSSSGTITDAEDTSEPTAPQLSLFNSKTRSKEAFVPVSGGKSVTMYTCGPTVYDYAHVGNFRAFLTYDVLKRALQYLGYDVEHICNLTDVDDKIIQRANELGLKDVSELTLKYEGLFLKDLKALNIVPATQYPRATQHIYEMLDIIRILKNNNLAYETSDGSWYFRTQSQDGYGQQLVNLNYEEMMEQERAANTASTSADEKEHFADFCLWKAFKEGVDREDAAWSTADFDGKFDDVTISKGRPGWHLECSAMARKFFGDTTIDLHGGGIDLKFPHHENEIAQSEGVTGNTFCNCWFHNGFVNLDNEKMSKSLGNFLTLRTACPQPIDVRAYRYLVASSQYRNPLAFTPECMKASKKAIQRIDKVRAQLEEVLNGKHIKGESTIADKAVPQTMQNFEAALVDDLNMPRAAASLFALVKEAEKQFKQAKANDNNTLDLVGLQAIQMCINKMDQVFGIFYEVPLSEEEAAEAEEASIIPENVMDLVGQRTAAKDAKDWDLADSLRKQITEAGFAVKDVKGGDPIVTRLE